MRCWRWRGGTYRRSWGDAGAGAGGRGPALCLRGADAGARSGSVGRGARVGRRDGAGVRGGAVFVETPKEAGAWMLREVRAGDAVLLKASRGVRLEEALEVLAKA